MAVSMELRFDDADPVAQCITQPSTSSQSEQAYGARSALMPCPWHGHGDSVTDAVTSWAGHVTAEHRKDWGDE